MPNDSNNDTSEKEKTFLREADQLLAWLNKHYPAPAKQPATSPMQEDR